MNKWISVELILLLLVSVVAFAGFLSVQSNEVTGEAFWNGPSPKKVVYPTCSKMGGTYCEKKTNICPSDMINKGYASDCNRCCGPNNPVKGEFERINEKEISGWVYDPDAPSSSLIINIYIDGKRWNPNYRFVADYPRQDLVNSKAIPSPNHGFNIKSPVLKRGNHIIRITALELPSGKETEIGVKTQFFFGPQENVQVATPNDILELNETVGDVRDTFTEFDLPQTLRNSMVGATRVNQYLQFPSSNYESNRVLFGEDNSRNVGTFLYTKKGTELLTHSLEFENGLIFKPAGNSIAELQGKNMNILGTNFRVVNVEFNSSASKSARISLFSGKTITKMKEGDIRDYAVSGKKYRIEVIIVSETNNEAILRVNGHTLPKMKPEYTEPTNDGILIGLLSINSSNPNSGVVEIALDAQKIVLKDDNWEDREFTKRGLEINNELIADDDVKIEISKISDGEYVLSGIWTRINANGIAGRNIFVQPGHGIREYLNEVESLITPNWDIRYEGLANVGTTTARINPVNRYEYRLEFINQEGLKYSVPLASQKQTNGILRRGWYGSYASGGVQQDLVYFEGKNAVNKFDYFVLSDIDTSTVRKADKLINPDLLRFDSKQTDDTGFTHLLRYDDYDSKRRILTFTDMATGTKQITVPANLNRATFVSGGTPYMIELSNPTVDNTELTVDVNGDGRIDGSLASIATEGGMLILIGSSIDLSRHAGPLASNDMPITFTTFSKRFDEGGEHLVRGVIITSDNYSIRMHKEDAMNLPFIKLNSEPEISQYTDKYGAMWELFTPTTPNTPEELTIEYPLSQRSAIVFLNKR